MFVLLRLYRSNSVEFIYKNSLKTPEAVNRRTDTTFANGIGRNKLYRKLNIDQHEQPWMNRASEV